LLERRLSRHLRAMPVNAAPRAMPPATEARRAAP